MSQTFNSDWYDSLEKIVENVAKAIIIFGGVLPFVPQYMKIKQSGNVEGFSTYVCFTLIIANLLRIFFWSVKRFELPLLAQSVCMILTMLVMMRLCVQVGGLISPDPFHIITKHSFTDFDKTTFWNWTDFSSYIQFLTLFCTVLAFFTFALQHSIIYVESLGFLAVFTEALLGFPQFIKNFKKKSTTGMSLIMVLLWTSGDTFKTFYYIVRTAPLQFVLCGILQIGLDLALLGQYLYYDRYHTLRTS